MFLAFVRLALIFDALRQGLTGPDTWPFPLDSLVFDAVMVAALTWLVLPQVTRLLHSWLHPSK